MNRLTTHLLTAAAVLPCAATILTAQQAGDRIVVRDAWIREAPAQRDTGAYLVIENNSTRPVSLVGVQAGTLAAAELHATKMDGAIMSMEKLASVVVPAHGVTELKPGGLHIMLFGLTRPLRPGDTAEIGLRFSNGVTKTVTAEVMNRAAMGR